MMLLFLLTESFSMSDLYSRESERHSDLGLFQMKASIPSFLFIFLSFFKLLALIIEYIIKLCSVEHDSFDIFCLQVKQAFQDMTVQVSTEFLK